MASAVKGFIGIGVAVIAFIFVAIGISNGLKQVEDAEKWIAYEHGVCLYVDGFSEERCNNLSDNKGQSLFNRYYGEGKTQWIYGENPRLGLGPLAN